MRVEFRVRVLTDEGEKFFGEGPYRLLRGVERLGSLRAAAGELGMAYSKATRIVGRAERLLGAPLTRRRIGGPNGGGSALTPLAQDLLARYEALRADCEAAVEASFARSFGDLFAAGDSGRALHKEQNRPCDGQPSIEENRMQREGESSPAEPDCEAAVEANFTRGFGNLPSPTPAPASDANCSPSISNRPADGSPSIEENRMQRDVESLPAEPDCEAAVEANFSRSFCDLPCSTTDAVADASFPSPAISNRPADGSPSVEENRTQRDVESSPAEMDCASSASKDLAQRDGESACMVQSMEKLSTGEPSPTKPDCASFEEEDRERRDDESPSAFPSREGSTDMAPVSLGCIVLAAGQGRRFGGGKLLAELGGRPVLARTLEALPRACFRRVAVVTSDPAVTALCREMGFPARAYPGGALSDSIREGLAEMDGTDGCMFVNGDQPLLRTDSLRRLAAAFAENSDCVHRLAHNGTAASPVVFPFSAYPALRALTGESGGMAALRSGAWEIRTVEAREESELWDVDDPAALERAKARLRENSRR